MANVRAFAVNHRFTPIDELNLNREFPGDVKGNYTQQLAAAITREFLEKIDIHIDLHAGTDRPTVDYVYIWNDEALSRGLRLEVPLPPVRRQGRNGLRRHHEGGDARPAQHSGRGRSSSAAASSTRRPM